MAIKDRIDEIIDALYTKNIFDESGNIPPWSSFIWKEVSVDLNRNDHNNKPITANYLYVVVCNNRYNILQLLKKKCGISEENNQLIEMNSDSEDEEIIYSLETVESCQNKSKSLREKLASKRFNVVIDYESYRKVQPVKRLYKTKNGKKKLLRLQEGWTDLFLNEFWKQHKIPCTYVVKKHHISTIQSSSFLSFNGQCKDAMCQATFIGEINNEPQVGEDVVVVFITQDTFGVDHINDKKRPLTNYKRKIVGEEISIRGASHWQKKFADENMEYGDVQGPFLYSKNVLRKAKQDVIDNNLGISRCNLLTSLTNLKHGSEHKGSIHTISFDKFFLHYWSPIQDHLYKTAMRNSWMVLSVDATGSLVIPLTRTENNISSGHILLYQMVMSCRGQTVPVAQQLSEKQDMLSIYYWMANWVATGMKPPNECVSDYSRALLGAITRSFCNRMTVKEYLETSFFYLLNKPVTLPQCFVRVDVAHIMHILSRWKCLKGRRQIKDFYLRCIAQLIQKKLLSEFKETLKNIFIVAMAEFDGNDIHGQPTPAENARKYLFNLISGTDIPVQMSENEEQTNYKGITTDDQFYCELEVNTKSDENVCIIDWVDGILQVASKEALVQGDRLNAYYCLDLITSLRRLCDEFPLWSAVMVEAFSSPNEIASSARVEGYFKDLKSSIIQKNTPRMRIDKFLVTHLREIRGAMKLAKSDMDIKNKKIEFSNLNVKKNTEKLGNNKSIEISEIKLDTEHESNEKFTNNSEKHDRKTNMFDRESMNALMNDHDDDICSNSKNNEILSITKRDNVHSNKSHSIYSRETTPEIEIPEELETENWKNKIENPKKKRSLYMGKHPEIKAKSLANPLHKKKIDILRNGNCLGTVTVKEKKESKQFIVLNTCPFDAVIQGIAIAYIDSNSYAEYLNCSKNELVKLAITLVKKGAIKEIYQKRAELLAPICKSKTLIGNIIELDANYNVNSLMEALLTSEPSIQEYHTCNNYKCYQNVIPRHFYPLNLGEIIKGSFSNLQTAIDNMMPPPFQQFERKCFRNGCDGKITVTKSLMNHVWFDTILNIIGESTEVTCRLFDIPNEVKIQKIRLIAVIDFLENKGGGIGHYVTHVKRASGYWESYNDLSKLILKCKSNRIVVPHALYYIRSTN